MDLGLKYQLNSALAGWLSWLERPIHQKVVGLIPGQGTNLGYGFKPWLWYIPEATSQCLSLSLFLSLSLPTLSLPLSLSLSLKSINISIN